MTSFEIVDNLFDFADFFGYEGKIKYLAENLAENELWKPKTITLPLPAEKDNFYKLSKEYPILASYILNTHKRISRDEKEKFVINDTKDISCWNSGLRTKLKEEIFVVFIKNDNLKSPTYWKFSKFLERSNRFLAGFGEDLPEMCDYGKNPTDLIFNVKAEIVPDLDHILNDHPERYPEIFKPLPDQMKRNTLSGAISDSKERAKRNYNIAVPQYFSGNIQLLLPLYLTSPVPDLALVLERMNDLVYRANTILPLDWAYNNARVIKKPDTDWLQP